MDHQPTDLHTASTAADFAGLHPSAIVQACDADRIAHVRTVGGVRLIEHRELLRFLADREKANAQ